MKYLPTCMARWAGSGLGGGDFCGFFCRKVAGIRW